MWVTIVDKLFNNFLVLNCQPFPQEKENKFVSQYHSKRHSVLVVKFTFNELKLVPHKHVFLDKFSFLEHKEQFGNIHTAKEKLSNENMSRKTCSCGNHRINGHKFLKIKRSV